MIKNIKKSDKRIEMDNLIVRVMEKEISVNEAVNQISVIIMTDYPLFLLEKYDEDFRANVVYEFLRTGHTPVQNYKKEYGSFHNYVISYVKGITQSVQRQNAVSKIKNLVEFFQSIDDYVENDSEHEFTLIPNNLNYIPYSNPQDNRKKILVKDFMSKRYTDKLAKPKIVVFCKACNDVSDYEIKMICNEFNLDEDNMYEIIQRLKNSLDEKRDNRNLFIERRNYAFANHRRYSEEVTDYSLSSEERANYYKKQHELYTKRWEDYNDDLNNGRYHFTPTNQLIAKELGICIRQVNYYLAYAKAYCENNKNH